MVEFRQALPVGSSLTGDYRITGVLGQGGFGITYQADDLRLGAPVAIKEYFPSELALRERGSTVVARSVREQGVLEWGRNKFLEEARTLARFRHASIVRVARLFEANNTAYMVLDFEMGPSLAQWRSGLGRDPTQAEVDRIAGRLLDAVGAVHEAGILHRDIKPANVIMRDGTEPVLIDFGAARQAFSAQSRTVHAIVTPGYSPKEQYAVDLDRQGTWSDIYALGATLYFLVTGKVPPDALSRDLGEEMRTAASARGPWRPGFLAAIDRAMSVRPEDRPQSTDEWRALLFAPGPAAPTAVARPGASQLATARAERHSKPVRLAGDPGPRRLTFDDLPQPGEGEKRPPSRARGLVLWALIVGAVAIGGLGYWIAIEAPARDEAAWLAATTSNTDVAYERYLAQQPSGRHVAEARQRRTALAEQAARASGVVLSADAQSRAASPSANRGNEGSDDGEPAPASPTPATRAEQQARATTVAQPPAEAAAASTPTQPRFEARASVPGALADGELARLAQSAPAATWRLALDAFSTDTVPGFTEQPGDFIAELGRVSGGKLTLTPLAGDAVVPRAEIMQRLRSDRQLMAWHAPLLESGRHIEFTLLAGAVPFGLGPVEHVRWMRAEGARWLEQAYIDIGTPVRAIPCGIAGGVGAWFRKEIRSPLEFRGLKVRGGHLIVRALRRLEAEAVTLPNTRELTAAFNQNRLDANFGVTPLTGIFLAQPRIANVYQYPGIHSPAYLFELLIGVETWTGLGEAQQRLIDEACRRNLDRWAEGFAGSQNDVLNRIRTQRVIVRPFTGPVREALKKAVDETLAEEAAKSPRFKEILASYERFRR